MSPTPRGGGRLEPQRGDRVSPGRVALWCFRRGGSPQLVLERKAPEELDLRFPSFLPDGDRFLYFVRRAQGQNRIYVSSLGGAPPKLIHEGQSRAIFAPPGHLLFARDGVLLAQRFDERSLQLLGEPRPLANRILHFRSNGGANFSASDRGMLAYTEGPMS